MKQFQFEKKKQKTKKKTTTTKQNTPPPSDNSIKIENRRHQEIKQSSIFLL